VIQAVEDLGELDNTLIIYISGDNVRARKACSTARQRVTTFNGVPVPVKAQYLWYPVWGRTRRSRILQQNGRGHLIRPSNGSSRCHRIFGGSPRAWHVVARHINDLGGIRRQFHHVIDIAPTISKQPAFRNPRWSTASSRVPSKG